MKNNKMFVFIAIIAVCIIWVISCGKSPESLLGKKFLSHLAMINPRPTEKARIIDNYYKLVKDKNNNYTVNLYSKDHKIINSITVPKEPCIRVFEDSIIQVVISAGSPNNYTYFYNTRTGNISDIFHNIKLAKNGKVVFMKEGKLIISDIFDKNKYYHEIRRNYSPTAEPSNAIINVKLIDNNSLWIDYLEGDKLVEKQETIKLE